MKYLGRYIILISFSLGFTSSWADDLSFCVANESGRCISLVCPSSSDPNCADNCREQAQNKCKSKTGQPTTYQTQQSAQQYDKNTCIASNYQQCLSLICVNSEDINCNSNCKKQAEQRCGSTSN